MTARTTSEEGEARLDEPGKRPSRHPLTRRRLLAGLAALSAVPGLALAEEDHLKGAHLRFIIPSPVGNGTDIVGRTFARHAQRLLPDTDVTVENMEGASGRIAEKTTWASGPEGLTVLFARGSMTYRVLLDPEGHPYGFGDFTWLGSISRDRWVVVSRRGSGLETIEDLIARDGQVLVAVDNVNAQRFKIATMLNYLTGTRLLPVPGYSSSDGALALIGGEVEVLNGTFETMYSLLEGGEATLLLRTSDFALPAPYDRAPALTNMPLDEEKRWVLRLLQTQSDLGRPVAAAPGLPPERARRLRDHFAQVVADPLFIEELTQGGFAVDPIVGEKAQEQMEDMAKSIAGRIDRLQAVFDCGLQRAETGIACDAV